MENKYYFKDRWNNALLEINTTENMLVNVYHLKSNYCAEFVFGSTKLKIYRNRKHQIEYILGNMQIKLIDYYSSNGSIIKKKLKIIETEEEWCGKTEINKDYKYIKAKESE